VTRTLADLAASAARMPAELQKAQRRGVQQAALLTTRTIRAEIRAATGGDMRLSGVGRRGARVGARYDIKGVENPTALITATGPLHLIERPTRPHLITPKRRKALRFKDGSFSMSAESRGTRGRQPFGRGVKKAAPQTGALFDREIQKAIARGWF
jgi:hypothetical protein